MRLARTLTVFDTDIKNKGREARERAQRATDDPRFGPLAARACAALPRLDEARLDLLASSFASARASPPCQPLAGCGLGRPPTRALPHSRG